MKLIQRFFLIFGLCAVFLCLAPLATLLWSSIEAQRTVSDVHRSVGQLRKMEDLAQALTVLRENVLSIQSLPGQLDVVNSGRKADAQMRDIMAQLDDLEATIADQSHNPFATLRIDLKDWFDAIRSWTHGQDALSEPSRNLALQAKVWDEMTVTVQAIEARSDHRVSSSLDAMRLDAIIAGCITLVLCAVALAVNYRFMHRVTSSIQSYSDVMGQLTRGEFDVEIPVIQDGSELQDIGESLVAFKSSLADREKMVRNQLAAVEALQPIIANIDSGIRANAAHAQATSDQAATLVSRAVELKTNAKQVDEETGKMADRSVAIQAEIEVSANKVKANAESAEKMLRSIEVSYNCLKDCRSEQDDALKILEEISEIADQTNLLSLNASIEAARSGQHGAGFAVVAQEIRALATSVHEASQNVKRLVEGFGHHTEAMEHAIGQSKTQATNVQTNAKQIKESIELADQSLRDIVEGNASISSIAAKQNGVSIELANNGRTLSEEAEQLRLVADALKTSSDGLRKVGVELRG